MLGNAKGYLKEIHKRFTNIGYRVQVFLLDASRMGVPQRRQRVFIIGLQNDFSLPKLVLKFCENDIFYKIIEDKKDLTEMDKSTKSYSLFMKTKIGDPFSKNDPKSNFFGYTKVDIKKVCSTVVSNHGTAQFHYKIFRKLNKKELCQIGSYSMDYDFGTLMPKYLIGMSVPPVMTAQIANQINLQWLSKI